MSKPIRLSSPRFRVVFGDRNDPDTWDADEVQSIGADMRLAESLFAKHRKQWGTPQDRPMHFQLVLAWYAMRNLGRYEGPLEQFETEVLELTDLDEEDTDDEEDAEESGVGPTRPDPTTD